MNVASNRLLEFAANYYDLKSFPAGEAKRSLERTIAKSSGGNSYKSSSKKSGEGEDGREKKKRKKDKK